MKKIDTVKMVRDIRDRMHEETKDMFRSQLIEFYRREAGSSCAGRHLKTAVKK
jgi:hypothetical protein